MMQLQHCAATAEVQAVAWTPDREHGPWHGHAMYEWLRVMQQRRCTALPKDAKEEADGKEEVILILVPANPEEPYSLTDRTFCIGLVISSHG